MCKQRLVDHFSGMLLSIPVDAPSATSRPFLFQQGMSHPAISDLHPTLLTALSADSTNVPAPSHRKSLSSRPRQRGSSGAGCRLSLTVVPAPLKARAASNPCLCSQFAWRGLSGSQLALLQPGGERHVLSCIESPLRGFHHGPREQGVTSPAAFNGLCLAQNRS